MRLLVITVTIIFSCARDIYRPFRCPMLFADLSIILMNDVKWDRIQFDSYFYCILYRIHYTSLNFNLKNRRPEYEADDGFDRPIFLQRPFHDAKSRHFGDWRRVFHARRHQSLVGRNARAEVYPNDAQYRPQVSAFLLSDVY